MSIPSRLGRYAVRRRIGAGGFATVWLAYDEQLDAPVAVKVLADNWTQDHQVRTRFVEEGRYLRRVESPHVVTVYDAGTLDDDRPYLVMTYADQGTLADRLEVAGVTVPQAAEIVRQVGAGLQALHDRGIIHRDVKPANVLFRTVDPSADSEAQGLGGGTVRAMVGDLGLGKALDTSSRLTMIAGTPSFVAPEQAAGESPDARADQYSLGVLTFQLLTGHTPWSHASLGAAADPPPPPSLSSEARPFSDAVERVVRRALAREPGERWPSVTAFAEALTEALGGAADPDGPPETRYLPPDSQLTQPGVRPSPPATGLATERMEPDTHASDFDFLFAPSTAGTSGPEPARTPAPTRAAPGGRPRRRLAVLAAAVVLCLLALAGGAAGGYALVRHQRGDVVVTDQRDALSVTVPDGWSVVDGAPWTPPGSESNADEPAVQFPSLSAGTAVDWQQAAGAEGVFAGILPDDRLPTRLPHHLGCGTTEDPVYDESAQTRTVVATDCPGVLVEQVSQVAQNRVLWVQVRAHDRSTANRVLAAVKVEGL